MGNGSTFGTDSGVGSTIALLEAQLPAVRERRSRVEAELAAVAAQEEAVTKALEGLRLLTGTPLAGQGGPDAGEVAQVQAQAQAVQEAGAAAESVEEQAAPSPQEPVAAAAGARKRTAAKKAPAKKTGSAKKTASARGTRAPAAGTKKTAGKKTAEAEPKAATKRVPAAGKTAPEAEPKAVAKRVPAAGKTAAAQPGPAGGESGVEVSVPQAGRRRKVADANKVLEVLSRAGGPLRAREVTGQLGLDAAEGNINAIRTTLERLAKDGRAQRTGRGLYTAADGGPGAGS